MANTPTWASATRVLLERTASSTGEAFFRALARGVAECMQCKFGLVGVELDGSRRMRVRAAWSAGDYLPPFEYDLEGTPCAEVIARGVCHFPRDVSKLFPRDVMLAEMGIDGYAGFRVSKCGAGPTGIIISLHDSPMPPLNEEITAALELFAQRAAVEFERESVEQELRASEARYREIVTTCAEGVWTVDAQGGTTFVNPQMASMLGHEPDEMIGRPFVDFMDDEMRHQAEVRFVRRRRGIRESHELRLKRKDKSDVWTIMATSPLLDERKNYVGALAMVSDVTQRRVLEARIQHAQKLESLGVLAGGIAHDFNNLLIGILGNAELALRVLPLESPAIHSIQDVRETALRLADLTQQILAYSGKGRFVVEPLDLNRLIEEIAHLLGTVVSKKATIRYHFAADLPAVMGDATQIRQIVMNLITNASDALADREGQVDVTTGLVHGDAEYLRSTYLDVDLAEGPYVFFEVSDTGAGMDATTAEKIFDPFFTTKVAGRGLGLAAVLGILRGHHGAIKVYSEVGKGTSMKVLLPVSEGVAPRRPKPAAESAPRNARGMILVADDIDVIRQVAAITLERAGYEVVAARDGREAVALVDAHAHELVAVLLDMTMPGLSGEQVFQHIRHVKPGLPVILTSGYTQQDATSGFVGKGLAGFMQKPWGPADLLRAITKALERPTIPDSSSE